MQNGSLKVKQLGHYIESADNSGRYRNRANNTKIKEIMNSYKIELEKNITARWEADANGNVLTRSVRPLVLVFLTLISMYIARGSGIERHVGLMYPIIIPAFLYFIHFKSNKIF